ncbi:MAG: hypothetical protein AAF745_17885 [Planctomycetota bacterium]
MKMFILWLTLCSAAWGQVVATPEPEPDRLAIGKTCYLIEGVTEPKIIDGFLVGGEGSGDVRRSPFGFVRVFPPDKSRVVVRAESKDRTRLLAERFGDGWRINHIGAVWVDIEVYQTFQIDENEIEFLTQRGEIQFTIEGKKPDPDDEGEDEDAEDEGDMESPFSANGLQVLIVYDTRDIIPPDQAEILFGGRSLDWLDRNCLKVDGSPAYRVLDKDTTGQDSSDEYLQALRLPRDSLPWLIVGNGRKGFSGPLPLTVDETIKILEEFK